MPRLLATASFLSALLLLGCGGDSGSGLDFREFDSSVEAFVADNELEGATAVVVHRDLGLVHLRGYGDFDRHRISLVASSSKVLSAGVLMRLADEGQVDLDAPISDTLGAWGEHKTDITTAQLLSNSSGMLGLLDESLYEPYLCQYLNGGTLADCAEAIYTADDGDSRVVPDTQFRYGGGQWQLAGGVAEVASGQTWDALIDETYTQPCGLENTAYVNHFMSSGMAYPDYFDGDLADLDPTDNPNIEGGAHTTAEDYGQILLMHLRDGRCGDTRVLSAEAVERMRQDRIGEVYDGTTIDPTLAGYGFGWWVDRQNEGVVADGGAYGAMPWLDVPRGYGAMIILEDDAVLGSTLRLQVKPILDEIFDTMVE